MDSMRPAIGSERPGMIGKAVFKEIHTEVVPASRKALEKFPTEELRGYAHSLVIDPSGTKKELIDKLVKSGRATLCASLGN